MSWHYLQGQEAESWEGSSLDGAPSALLKLIPTPEKFCLPDKPTDASNRSPFGMTLRRSTGTDGEEVLTWFQGDSPVRTYRPKAAAPESTGNARDCGPKWHESFAKYNPGSYSWRTRQCSLFGGLTEFSGTWPRWGMMRNGECSRLAMLVHDTSVRGAGSWPTPLTACSTTVNHGRESVYAKAQRLYGKSLLPASWECLMGWPIGWSHADEPLETDRFRQWLNSHGRR